jgi:hypothetical protein
VVNNRMDSGGKMSAFHTISFEELDNGATRNSILRDANTYALQHRLGRRVLLGSYRYDFAERADRLGADVRGALRLLHGTLVGQTAGRVESGVVVLGGEHSWAPQTALLAATEAAPEGVDRAFLDELLRNAILGINQSLARTTALPIRFQPLPGC